MPSSFAIDAVSRALQGAPVRSVEIVETFAAATAEVARLRIQFFDGRSPLVAIGKRSTGSGLAAARRELRFYRELAHLWKAPAPRLYGASSQHSRHGAGTFADLDAGAAPRHDDGHGDRDGDRDEEELLLLSEDLGAAGYALAARGPTPAQLGGAIEVLVALQARFWEALPEPLTGEPPATSAPSISRAAQAWPPTAIAAHTAALRAAARDFRASQGGQLSAEELGLLDELVEPWEQQLLARVRGGRALTLAHGDFHFFGNIFFAPGEPLPRVIDWSELKPSLPAYDLAYCLHAVPLDEGADRKARDLEVLRSYWERLRAAGVKTYSWELCQWDFHASMVAGLFQALFQDSARWFRDHAATVALHQAAAALRTPPPLS